MESQRIIRSWKRSSSPPKTVVAEPPRPAPRPAPRPKKPIEPFLEEFNKYKSPQKIRDMNEAKELRVKSTEKERKRQDELNLIKQKRDKKITIRSSLNHGSKSLSSQSPKSPKSSPPASGYKYTTFLSAEKILEEGLRKNDPYMIKNALKRGAGFNIESIPSVQHLMRLDKYKELSQDELKNLKESIVRHLQVTDLRTIQNDVLNLNLKLLNFIENRIY
jgi:hypothetical protein